MIARIHLMCIYLQSNNEMRVSTARNWIKEQAMLGRLFFTREELAKALPVTSESALTMGLQRAQEARLISVAWQGFYLILPPTYAKQGTLPVTMYLDALMKYLERPYCIALLNAAAFYGAAHQSPQTFTVMTHLPIPRARTQHGTRLEFVGKREFIKGIPPELLKEFKTPSGYVRASSPEFTALTLIQYAKRVGGLSRVLTVLEELLEACHFDKMPDSILSYIPLPCFQRLGYMAESLLGDEERSVALYKFLDSHRLSLQNSLLSLENRSKTGTMNKRWKLIINETLESDLS